MTAGCDVVVIGGGPAGLATAIAAGRQGLRVEVLERFQTPIDKPCGEGLLPNGLAALEALGVNAAELPSRELEGIRYVDGETVAEGPFCSRLGRGIRRLVLHEALAGRAEEVGARLSWGVTVKGIESVGDRWSVATSEDRREARWLVGADGLSSRVREWSGLSGRPAKRQRFGARRHYRLAPWSSFVEVYWREGCEAYVTPVDDDLVGVALLWSGRSGGFDFLLEGFPELAARLAGATEASRTRGCGPLRRRARHVVGKNLALVGDASGYTDALTGEGLGLAFQQGLALAKGLARGSVRYYPREHRRIGRAVRAMTELTLLLSRSPALRRRVIDALRAQPELFTRLLATQDREAPLLGTGVPTLVELALRTLVSKPERG